MSDDESEMTPEQQARAAAERWPGTRYKDGRPKYHRHFADEEIHRDEGCPRPSTPRRVYVFDSEDLDQHERFLTERARNEPTAEQDAVADALAEAVKYVEPSIRKAVAFDILTRQLEAILSRPHPFPYQIPRLFVGEQKDTVEDRVKRLEAIGEFYNDLTRDMSAAVRLVVDAISADVGEAEVPNAPLTCGYCGHQAHGPVCYNMASDNDCSCKVDTRRRDYA